MRIIKAAKRKEEVIITCFKCKSVLGIQSGDYHWDSNTNNHFVRCPVCLAEIKVPKSEEMFPWLMEDEENDGQLQSDNTMRINTL